MVCNPPGSRLPRQEYWSGLPSFSGDLPDPRIEPMSPELADEFFITGPPGKSASQCAHPCPPKKWKWGKLLIKCNPSIENAAKNNSRGQCELCNTAVLSMVDRQWLWWVGGDSTMNLIEILEGPHLSLSCISLWIKIWCMFTSECQNVHVPQWVVSYICDSPMTFYPYFH